jgi:hypothetical protein
MSSETQQSSGRESGGPRLFTTGAFIIPVEIEVNGVAQWRWIVEAFVDDTFYDGEIYNAPDYANTKENLLKADE